MRKVEVQELIVLIVGTNISFQFTSVNGQVISGNHAETPQSPKSLQVLRSLQIREEGPPLASYNMVPEYIPLTVTFKEKQLCHEWCYGPPNNTLIKATEMGGSMQTCFQKGGGNSLVHFQKMTCPSPGWTQFPCV